MSRIESPMRRVSAPPIGRAPAAVPATGPAGPVPAPGAAGEIALPVASVVLEVPLAHLDHPFDYAVPPALDAAAVPGARVQVRLAGRRVGGFVVDRLPASAHPGRLAALSAVVSAEPVLTPEILELSRRVAARCAGTTADVLRLAVPPRHARVEAEEAPPVPEPGRAGSDPPRPGPPGAGAPGAGAPGAGAPGAGAPGGGAPGGGAPGGGAPGAGPAGSGPTDAGPSCPDAWSGYVGGSAFLTRLAARGGPRAVLAALPGELPGLVAAAVAQTLAAGRGSVVVVPDVRDLTPFDAALTAALGPDRHVVLTAELGPAVRYRRWLAVRRGRVRVVLGTRAASFAPVAEPGLFACYDDGDDLLAEPRAPYCHARDVLALRAAADRAGLLLAGYAVSAAASALVRSGFAQVLGAPRDRVRARTPGVVVAGDDVELARDPAGGGARVPGLVLRTVRAALAAGPVLVQTPRAGYRPHLTCDRCREPARCPVCAGPLHQAGPGGPPTCRWCGRPAVDHRCPACGSHRFRSRTVGSMRTAEELGRAFPGVPVLLSGGISGVGTSGGGFSTGGASGGGVLPVVPDGPALVVATPGAEPRAPSGYAAAALLDGAVALDRPELAAAEEAARRWFGAAALVRAGAPVVLVAAPDQRAVQALVRWDPVGFADSELADRVAARLPPAAVVAELTGSAVDVADLLSRVDLPAGVEVLGPVAVEPDHRSGPRPGGPPGARGASGSAGPSGSPGPPAEPTVRAIVRTGPGGGAALTTALRLGQSARSVRRAGAHVRIRIDPTDLG